MNKKCFNAKIDADIMQMLADVAKDSRQTKTAWFIAAVQKAHKKIKIGK